MLYSEIYSPIILEWVCNNIHCPWDKYVKGQDWDYYLETGGDCESCKQRCNKDRNCGAIECGGGYCSWWKNGICEIGDDSISRYFTCRFPSKGIVR